MSIHKEIHLEDEICADLTAAGWLSDEQAAKSHEEGPCCATSRSRCAHQGEGGQEGQPSEESAHGRNEGQGFEGGCPRR